MITCTKGSELDCETSRMRGKRMWRVCEELIIHYKGWHYHNYTHWVCISQCTAIRRTMKAETLLLSRSVALPIPVSLYLCRCLNLSLFLSLSRTLSLSLWSRCWDVSESTETGREGGGESIVDSLHTIRVQINICTGGRLSREFNMAQSSSSSSSSFSSSSSSPILTVLCEEVHSI